MRLSGRILQKLKHLQVNRSSLVDADGAICKSQPKYELFAVCLCECLVDLTNEIPLQQFLLSPIICRIHLKRYREMIAIIPGAHVSLFYALGRFWFCIWLL